MFRWFKKEPIIEQAITVQQLLSQPLPQHVAIIMDGNGRWAEKKRMPRVKGHYEGMKTIKHIARVASQLNIKVLTVYAFSTENWRRPKDEVDFLMKLPQQMFESFIPELMSLDIKVIMTGYIEQLPQHTLKSVAAACQQTQNNKGLVLNFALNYGGRAEIVTAVKQIAQQVKDHEMLIDDITEQTIQNNLLTAALPNPDLVIRTSGELRISNFLLWQIAYSEFIFTDVLWPDFDKQKFYQCLSEFQKRQRRFGGLNKGEVKYEN